MNKGPEHFFQRGHTNSQTVHEKVLKSVIIREMQIKSTIRYHLTSVSTLLLLSRFSDIRLCATP